MSEIGPTIDPPRKPKYVTELLPEEKQGHG